MLVKFNTTIGKLIFGIRLEKKDKSPLRYFECLKRYLIIWTVGSGLNLPILSLYFQSLSFLLLTKNNETFWDNKGDFIIVDRRAKNKE